MSNIAVEAEQLGKCYELGPSDPRAALLLAMNRVVPWSQPRERDLFWAVRDISFRIAQGETVGILGRNGAGKSTLLKVLSRVTKPSEGRARVNGRLGTLLEVGTGFHHDLSGRENVYLSGAILGMSHSEVAKKFDEIVDFAEVEKFIDTPVKRYSSGMYVRLAFAVASFLEPDVLIVDEVLAVGDAAFQRKSITRLNETSTSQGRTILFVSHALQSVRSFCRRVILLENGRIVFDGPAAQGIERYLTDGRRRTDLCDINLADRLKRATGQVCFTEVACSDANGSPCWEFRPGEVIRLKFDLRAYEAVPSLSLQIKLRHAATGETITTAQRTLSEYPIEQGWLGSVELRLGAIPLRPNDVSMYVWLGRKDNRISYDVVDENVSLPTIRIISDEGDPFDREGLVSLAHEIKVTPRNRIDSDGGPVSTISSAGADRR